jgi:maltose alpha-D-glucosyltransferase/alpha-amylase
MIPALEVTGAWETVLEGGAGERLERTVLPDFLRAQRWFGGKARRVESVRVIDWGDFPTGAARSYLALLEVSFAEGVSDRYFFPLSVTGGQAGRRLLESMQPWVIARLAGPEGEAVLHDALADDYACKSLLAAIGSHREFALRSGRVVAYPTAAFSDLRGNPDQPLPVERGPATSSNSLVFFGERLLLKLFRRLEAGINPDFEIGHFLTEKGQFERMPRVAGTIEYHGDGSEFYTLAILQARVTNQADGWKHVLDELSHYYQRASASESAPESEERSPLKLVLSTPPCKIRDAIATYLKSAATLGRRTAELHRALAGDANDPHFAPEPFTAADADALRESIRERGRKALDALRDNLDKLSEEVAPSARQLMEEGPQVLDHLEESAPYRAGAAKIRVHGDYHLGQVLRVENDFVILDFEGEPTRTVEERRTKQSPLKDVAGMIRSFHYAAYAGLFAFSKDRPEEFGRLEPWADAWFRWVSAVFLHEYLAGADGAAFLPDDPAQFAVLLNAFMLDKAFYELNYELNNRPDWVRIPLHGILALLNPGEPTAVGAG